MSPPKVEYIPDQAPLSRGQDSSPLTTPLFLRQAPLTLLSRDTRQLLSKVPYLRSTFSPTDHSAPHRELRQLGLVFAHVILAIVTLVAAVVGIVFSLGSPGLLALAYWAAGWLVLVYGPAVVFNGTSELGEEGEGAGIVVSDVKGVEAKEGEAWIYINGILAGSSFLQDNINLLSETFQRPITAIHNRTYGFLIDILECIVQRDLFYITQDTRIAHNHLKRTLLRRDITKVVLIAHSQGAIIASNVLDILYAELSHPEMFSKLEVYTFGSGATRFCNPPLRRAASASVDGDDDRDAGSSEGGDAERQIRVVEHYVNENDFVAQIGILQCFPPRDLPSNPNRAGASTGNKPTSLKATRPIATKTSIPTPGPLENPTIGWSQPHPTTQYLGKVFIRLGQNGHMFNEHYLHNMFPTAPGGTGTSFLDTIVEERYGSGSDSLGIDRNSGDNGEKEGRGRRRTVRDMSRLWKYMNGNVPE